MIKRPKDVFEQMLYINYFIRVISLVLYLINNDSAQFSIGLGSPKNMGGPV